MHTEPTAPADPPVPNAFVLAPAQGETRWTGDTRTRFLATGASTGDGFSLVEETARQGEAVPLHRHADDPESFYVLDGEILFFLADHPGLTAGPAAFLYVPGGVVHGFRILSATARYLILTTARHGEFYRAISTPAKPDGPETDWGRIIAIAETHGIELIGDLPEAPAESPAR